MSDALIYDAVRTPRGKGRRGGALNAVTPIELSTTCYRALRDRNGLDTALVEDSVLGCSGPFGEQGGAIARITALNAGFDQVSAGAQLDRFCGSGLDAIHMVAANVKAGAIDLGIGGGVESMSRVPMASGGSPWMSDPQVAWATSFVPQGISADLIATKFGYGRDELDGFAVESQRKAKAAQDEDRFDRSIVPVHDVNGAVVLDYDEYARPNTTLADLAKLEPSFRSMGEKLGYEQVALYRYPDIEKIDYRHHAGNSSGIVDGASAVLVGSEEGGRRAGLKPRARIRGWANVGVEPAMMLHGPWPATQKALAKAGLSIEDIDLFEVNEAFAAVPIHFARNAGVDMARINVDGGSIALGHPIGATGGMLVATLIDSLERDDKQFGLVTMCVGAGMGVATVIERL